MSSLSPFADVRYELRDDDLVRFRASDLDDRLSLTVRSLADGLDQRRDDVRVYWDEETHDTLSLFARRRLLTALRDQSSRAIEDAFDAYALMPRENDVPWESWFKATAFVARQLGVDVAQAQDRFREVATVACANRADVAFDALARIDYLGQCHVFEVSTTYGPGLVETTVVRDQGAKSWGGITGMPVSLGQYAVGYAPTTNLAQMAATIADALDATDEVSCSSIRQDQLVGATFDLVTSGSYVESLGCLSFFADAIGEGPSIAVSVAEIGDEEHYDVIYEAEGLAEELAEAADSLTDQVALVVGPCVVVLSLVPDFEAFDDEVPFDDDADDGADDEAEDDESETDEAASETPLEAFASVIAVALPDARRPRPDDESDDGESDDPQGDR